MDWWSLGIMLHVMLTGDLVFDIQTLHEIDRAPPEVRSQAQRERISSASVGPPDATDLVMRLLIFEPAHRLGTNGGLEAVRAHSFFAAIDWARLERLELPPRLPVLAGAACPAGDCRLGPPARPPGTVVVKARRLLTAHNTHAAAAALISRDMQFPECRPAASVMKVSTCKFQISSEDTRTHACVGADDFHHRL